jgi:hypothetical protein
MTASRNSDIETRRIAEDQLEDNFARFSKHFLVRESTNRVDIELLGNDLGDQIEAQNVALLGVTYDPRSRALEFELEGGDHRVFNPREVWVAEEPDGFMRSIEIVKEDGTREIGTVKRVAVVPVSEARTSSSENERGSRAG